MQSGEHHRLWCHRLEIILVTLSQFRADLCLGFAHIFDGSLHRYYSLQIERIDVVDTGNGNFGVGFLHDSLDGVASFADYPAN